MQTRISFGEAFRYWLKLGFISFGGPTGQIAIMHKDMVEKKRWIDEDHFLQSLNRDDTGNYRLCTDGFHLEDGGIESRSGKSDN
jgi:hypothetical protein